MSTDELYDEMFGFRYQYPQFLGMEGEDMNWMLGKALEHARDDFREIFIYKRGGSYWMTNVGVPLKERVARVYPGGRIEYRPE